MESTLILANQKLLSDSNNFVRKSLHLYKMCMRTTTCSKSIHNRFLYVTQFVFQFETNSFRLRKYFETLCLKCVLWDYHKIVWRQCGDKSQVMCIKRKIANNLHLRLSAIFLVWCHQESNRGHKDFQSFALPSELWHQLSMCRKLWLRLICGCKGNHNNLNNACQPR